ncbi:Aat Leu/Phe-tRNA-protein transferase [Burkholderiales bacterium]
MSQANTPRLSWIEPDGSFPPSRLAWPEESGANGLLAASDQITVPMLLQAYRRGIFPWSGPGEPVLWWTPTPRMVLRVSEFRRHRSLRQAIRKAAQAGLVLRLNDDFVSVMRACAQPREGQDGTWITPAIIRAYAGLHTLGCAHSISLHRGTDMIGGLYLVSIGHMIFGESMFSREPNASKLCLDALVRLAESQGAPYIDCQQQTQHLALYGAHPIARERFESEVLSNVDLPALDWGVKTLPWPTSATSP